MSDGQLYVPFRETVATGSRRAGVAPAVLQPRFRLRGTGRPGSIRHRVFWRVCIVTTPFFVGVEGFRSKLWMYDPETGSYAGLYDWDDPDAAEAYARGGAASPRGRTVRRGGARGHGDELVRAGDGNARLLNAVSAVVSWP